MDKRVKDLVDFTRGKWGLENYYLHTYNFSRTLNATNETTYSLNMEWYPSHITHQEDENYNPEGTAVIDLNVKNRQFERVIFVKGKNFTNKNVVRSTKLNDIVKFIESETGLKYEDQFRLKSQEKNELRFKSCIDGTSVSPPGTIEIKFDQKGKMTYFSLYGPFPSMDEVKVEAFSLKLKDVEQTAKEQLKLMVVPSRKQKKLIPIYGLEEIYIKNDQSKTLPFIYQEFVYKIEQKMSWEVSNKKSFKQKLINWEDDLTVDQFFSGERHPDLIPISENEINNCIMAVKEFLSQVYSGDTGKWVLKTLQRERGYISALLGFINQGNFVFKRKLSLFIDLKTFKVMNYMDNKTVLKNFDDFQKAGNITIQTDEAFEFIKSKIELSPVYVYDFRENNYVLCGKLDCEFGINGNDGQIVKLSHL